MGPLQRFRTKFRASRVTLPAAAIATAITACCLLLIWFERPDGQDEMDRYGSALAATLADTTAPELFNTQRITLTVVANRLTTLEEVAGVAFHGADEELMALSGLQRSEVHYRAIATIDNTPSGAVTVSLNPDVFAPAIPWSRWFFSVLALLLTPTYRLSKQRTLCPS